MTALDQKPSAGPVQLGGGCVKYHYTSWEEEDLAQEVLLKILVMQSTSH